MNDIRHHLVVDLEATCSDHDVDPHTVPRDEMEIIEIGAVMADATTFEPVAEFQAFVRPVRHPELTEFCRSLTTIRQVDVEAADPYPAVLERFVAWAAPFAPYLFGSWGAYDRRQFESDCRYHGVPYPFENHVNLKRRFSEAIGVRRQLGMAKALHAAGLELVGTHHRGLDDARNIARLLPYVFGDDRIDRTRIQRRR